LVIHLRHAINYTLVLQIPSLFYIDLDPVLHLIVYVVVYIVVYIIVYIVVYIVVFYSIIGAQWVKALEF